MSWVAMTGNGMRDIMEAPGALTAGDPSARGGANGFRPRSDVSRRFPGTPDIAE
jgi:hypothetical protein